MKIPQSGLRGLALREAAPDLMRTINLVRGALEAKINSASAAPSEGRKWFDLDAVYEDRAVICLDGRHWSYPYTLDAGVVTLGDPQEVIETFVALTEAAPSETAGLRLVEAAGQASGVVWDATLIVAGQGTSAFYSDAVLREAAPRFDGVRVCIKADAEHLKGSARDLRKVVGWIESPRFVEGAGADRGQIAARLNLSGLPENTRNLLVAAIGAGKTDIAGLSIDAYGSSTPRMVEGKRGFVARSIDRIESVDLIVEPGAGGRLIRLVEAAPELPTPSGDPEMKLREKMLRFVEAKAPAAYAKLDPETVSDDDLETAYREALLADKPVPKTPDLDVVEERIRMIEARAVGNAAIAASTLPQPAKDRLQRAFATRERFVEADVTAAIKEEREYLARFAESGRVNLGDFDQVKVEDRSVKVADMLDAFFDAAHKDHRSVTSFKECYIEITGDKHVTGRLSDCDKARLRESAGMNFREALDSSSFADVLGNSMTRRLQAIYTGMTDLQSWRKVATVGRTNDFRTQEVGRIGGYGNLTAVAEGAAYPALGSPGDDKATWGVSKRGGTEKVTLEMIKNDDVRVITRIPQEMALAGANTLYEFVFDFFRTNPNAADGVALYHATHGNLFTVAFSAAQFAAHRLAMQKQTRAGSGKRMGTSPGVLLLPFELQEAGYDAFVRNQNLDKTFVQTINPEVIIVDYWTDATDWVTVAPKDRMPILEIDFLDGQEEPELFVQDSPTMGSMFTNDQLTYKIRHIYGGNLLVDAEKGTTKAVVA